MRYLCRSVRLGGLAVMMAVSTGITAQPVRVAAASCETPPVAACNQDGCPAGFTADLGNAVDPKTGRRFFLDYPCDLQAGEKVTFILSLHGATSIANWMRHYFPAFDHKEKHRLVIATPSAGTTVPIRMWIDKADDEHLQNVVDLVFEQFGRENINAFWLAGHSQGGLTANRIVCSDHFKDKVDGWLSLSGGRIGRAEIAPDFFGKGGPPATFSALGAEGGPRPGVATEPACDISYIFTSGELEIVALPETSPWAEKYHCDARVRGDDIVDTRPGYVSGASEGRPASWGRAARPGTAAVHVYPNCDGNKLVADVIRLDKGHVEGLEPNVTEALIEMMVAAPGGKAQH